MTTATRWRCATCRAVGQVEHQAGAAACVVLALIETAHAVKQPRCTGRPGRATPTGETAHSFPHAMRIR